MEINSDMVADGRMYGVNITEEDKVDIERIHEKLHASEDLQEVVHSDNSIDNLRYKFNKVVDELLLDFVNTKTDLYRKLSEPKVNTMFKRKWFDGFQQQYNL